MNPESVEIFLARGGRIQQIEKGKRSGAFNQLILKENPQGIKRPRGQEVAAGSDRSAAK